MNTTSISDSNTSPDEITVLVDELRETERRLQELTDGEVDSFLLKGGGSYLLQDAQHELRRSVEMFRSVFTASAAGIAISTPGGRYLHVNDTYCQMLGYAREELLAIDFKTLTHPDDLALNLQLVSEILSGQRDAMSMEKRYLKKGGGILWVNASAAASRTESGEIETLTVVAVDITDRKMAEVRLKGLNRLHIVLSKIGEAIVRVHDTQALYDTACRILVEDGNLRMVSIARADAATGMAEPASSFGTGVEYLLEPACVFPAEEGLLSDGPLDTAFPTGAYNVCNDIAAAPQMKPCHEAALKHGFLSSASFPLSLRGAIVGVLVVYADETNYFEDEEIRLLASVAGNVSFALESMEKELERKVAEHALELKQARYQRLVESNVQGVIFWGRNGEITGANDAFLRMVRHTREDLEAGRIDWKKLTPPEYVHLDQRCLAELGATGIGTTYEKEYVLTDGTRVPILLGSAAFPDNPDEGVCFIVDLTERKKLEEQFLRAQRMESIGTLAGGIAHDLNNILAPITLSIELLKSMVRDPASAKILETIELSAQRGTEIVRQILSFTRGVKSERTEINARQLLADLEKIVTGIFPKDIRLKFIVPEDTWMLLADPTQVHQILLNLCVNARDAMPHGGKLTVSVENFMLDEQYATMNIQARKGHYVQINVTDTGMGMSKAVVDRIFEPFFTTKDVNKGTGLGLSTVMAIVKSHEGVVNVYSEPGKGTTFKVYLPAAIVTPQAAKETSMEPAPVTGGSETILVVDDEASILDITSEALQASGYRVLTAGDGAAGVAVYIKHMQEISVVLTDMTMPVMDGAAMIHAIRRINPAVKVIAASGMDMNGAEDRATLPGVKHYLTKPYPLKTLREMIRKVLAES